MMRCAVSGYVIIDYIYAPNTSNIVKRYFFKKIKEIKEYGTLATET